MNGLNCTNAPVFHGNYNSECWVTKLNGLDGKCSLCQMSYRLDKQFNSFLGKKAQKERVEEGGGERERSK